MATAMKTPGVYIVEKNAFPNSVVEVPTAVPVFIGFTQKALHGAKSLTGKPWRITSMADYLLYFGGEYEIKFNVAETPPNVDFNPNAKEGEGGEGDLAGAGAAAGGQVETIVLGGKIYYVSASKVFNLYYHMRLFYANGGGPCYIISMGGYTATSDAETFTKGITASLTEQEPTLLVIPEAMNLAVDESVKVQQAMLLHCDKVKNRFAILDVSDGYKALVDNPVFNFRNKIGNSSFGAVYYPWLRTSVVSDKEVSFKNADATQLMAVLNLETATWEEAKKKEMDKEINKISTVTDPKEISALHDLFLANLTYYGIIMRAINQCMNLLPASAAIAGVYTRVDNNRGVWKAPANVTLNNIISPAVNVSHDDQESLNVDTNGKSVNAIRPFTGEGIKVWGARTLDGNSLDWRYISVRRTLMFLEESVKNAAKVYVFEPNDANTWLNIKSMIENFLRGVWKRGGLAGAIPDDAYSVHVGLGETMTGEDILEGIMRITVLVAVTHPAEFIEITFQQQMQKS